jgi:hypothetical protein
MNVNSDFSIPAFGLHVTFIFKVSFYLCVVNTVVYSENKMCLAGIELLNVKEIFMVLTVTTAL